jgi:hypothetical protein
MMVHGRHMSLYDEDSVLILVMATNFPGIRTLISGTFLLILPIFVPGCCRDWYMLARPALLFFFGCTRLARLDAAHLLRPKGKLDQKQGNHSFKSYKVARCPQAPTFPRAPCRPRASAGACGRPRRPRREFAFQSQAISPLIMRMFLWSTGAVMDLARRGCALGRVSGC